MLVTVDPTVQIRPEDIPPVEPWVEEMDGRGVRLDGERLGAVNSATMVRTRDGVTTATDGPFAETKEWIAGYDLLECKDMAEAIEVAAKHPVARFGALELRPIWED
jgi:hypothetical protein